MFPSSALKGTEVHIKVFMLLLKAIMESILPPHVNNLHCTQWFSRLDKEYISASTIAKTQLSVFRVGRKLRAAAGALEKLTSYVFMTCLKQSVSTFQELPQLLGKAKHVVWSQQPSALCWSLIKPPTEKATIGETLLWASDLQTSGEHPGKTAVSTPNIFALVPMNYTPYFLWIMHIESSVRNNLHKFSHYNAELVSFSIHKYIFYPSD